MWWGPGTRGGDEKTENEAYLEVFQASENMWDEGADLIREAFRPPVGQCVETRGYNVEWKAVELCRRIQITPRSRVS